MDRAVWTPSLPKSLRQGQHGAASSDAGQDLVVQAKAFGVVQAKAFGATVSTPTTARTDCADLNRDNKMCERTDVAAVPLAGR